MSLYIKQCAAEAWDEAGSLTLYAAESSFGFEVGMRRVSFLSNKTESTVDSCQVETFMGVGSAGTTWNPLPTPTRLTGQIPFGGVLLPPDGKLVNLQLPVVRYIFILIADGLGLVLFEALQGPEHARAARRPEGLGARAEGIGQWDPRALRPADHRPSRGPWKVSSWLETGQPSVSPAGRLLMERDIL